MNDKYQNLEQYKLKELEKDFSKKGYKVVIRPRLFELPDFLREIPSSPDLLATSPDDNVVVEIKSRKSIKSDVQLAKLAEAVNAHEKWSFMLVYTNPKTKRSTSEQTSSDKNSIYKHIELIKSSYFDLDSEEILRAYFLLLWSAFEAAATTALQSNKSSSNRKTSLSLIRDITMAGLISRSDNEKLENLFRKRNKLSHGFLNTKISQENIKKLISICEELVEVEKS